MADPIPKNVSQSPYEGNNMSGEDNNRFGN